jgi:hypothetical protein
MGRQLVDLPASPAATTRLERSVHCSRHIPMPLQRRNHATAPQGEFVRSATGSCNRCLLELSRGAGR